LGNYANPALSTTAFIQGTHRTGFAGL